MNDLETPVCPARNPRLYGGNHIIKLQSLTKKEGGKALSFLTGVTQIASTRPDLTHLLSMKLNLSD